MGIFLFFTNCEKLETVEPLEKNQGKYMVKKVKTNEINNNIFLTDKLSELKQKKDTVNGYAARYNNVHFNLNLNEAAYIESADGSYHSYTFSIYNEDDSYDINNIVLVSYNGQDYDAYLSTYTLTQEERDQLADGINLDLSQKASLETFDINQINTYSRVGGGCFRLVLTEIYSDCPAGHNAFACTTDCCGGCFGYVHEWQEEACPGGGGGGGTGSGDGSGGTGTGTGGGGGTGSGNGNTIPTTPVGIKNENDPCNPAPNGDLNGDCILDYYEACLLNGNSQEVCDCVTGGGSLFLCAIKDCLGEENQSDSENTSGSFSISALNLSQQVLSQIYTYLVTQNNCSEDAKNFTEAVIQAGANAEVDYAYEVIVDETFKNNPCLYGVYEEMGKAPTFNSYLQNFEPQFSVAHLKFSSSTSLPSNTNATTSAPQNYLITITFNENNLDRPRLFVARTFIHEIIHAEIFRKMLSCAGLPHVNFNNYTEEQWVNYIINLQNSFPGIYDYYVRWAVQNQNPSAQQHEMMAQHYRYIIEQALREFDNSHSDEIYEALAWVGLQNTVTWNNLSQTERDNISQTVTDFENNNENCQ